MKCITARKLTMEFWCVCGNETVSVTEIIPQKSRIIGMSFKGRAEKAMRIDQRDIKKIMRRHLKQIIVEASKCQADLWSENATCCEEPCK